MIIIGEIELLMAFGQPHSPIARFAHLGGMLFGFVYLKWDDWKIRLFRWREDRKTKKNLRVTWNRDREMEQLQREVDDLLDKINEGGIDSLTRTEVNRLKEASQKLKEWETRSH